MDTPERDNATMNPQIVRGFEVGTRNLRQLTIYPLSMGDQVELEGIITKCLTDWYAENVEGGDNIAFVTFILDALKSNMLRILELITDAKKEELVDIGKSFSNFQLTELIALIYNMNYLDPFEKNLKSLPLMDKLSQLVRQPPSFSDDTLSTELKTSSESILKKEDSLIDSSDSSSKKPMRTKREG